MMAKQQHIRLSISGMSCAGCVATVEGALRAVPGVTEASVNFAEHTADVSGSVPSQTLLAAVKAAGYEAAELKGSEDQAVKEAAEMAHYRRLLRKAAVAASVTTLAERKITLLPPKSTNPWPNPRLAPTLASQPPPHSQLPARG